MKTKLLITLLFIINFSFSQNKTFKSSQFNWKIEIPEQCELIESENWLKEKNKENTKKGYKLETDENSKILIAIKIDSLNYFVAYNDNDFKTNSNAFMDFQKAMYEVSLKNVKIEVNKSDEKLKISNIEFNHLKHEYIFPDKSYLITEVYGTSIKKKVFSVFLIYNDKEKGAVLLENFKNSIFK
ncbi:hypothetical protein QWY99_04185 [Flavobacterium branchiarum]|uniref:Uncharacterized protein n=1 Tax=Flavobacterium branchiarum TaxID=1114870 RepID=A0ABV5FKI0_9FLAO|nr:hypothetical protein [Flavobacterium branchiarum]MDN3672258.1 hypothetical protein [Flavobacterium branchiarum]